MILRMKKPASFGLLILGLITVLIVIILTLTGAIWIVTSLIFTILKATRYSDISFSLFFISLTFFFFFLTEKKGKILLFNLSIIIFILGATEKYLTLSNNKY